MRHCFIFQLSDKPEEAVIEGGLGKNSGPPILRISKISESCHRDVVPGIDGNMAFNFTSNGNLYFALNFVNLNDYCFLGTCEQSTTDNASSIIIPVVLLIVLSLSATLFLR